MGSTQAKPVPREQVEESSVVAPQILAEASKEGGSVKRLGEMALADPVFALRVLRMVNSPAFGLGKPLTDVKHATSLLGLRGLRNVALSFVVSDMLPSSTEGNLILAQCLRRAILCQKLAALTKHPKPDELFSIGLLLEVGLLKNQGSHREMATELARLPSEHRVLYERAAGLPPHPFTGAQLATDYGLPEETVEAVLQHHDDPAPEPPSSRIAWVAERLASLFEAGRLDRLDEVLAECSALLSLTPEQLQECVSELSELVESASDAFQRELGPQPDLEQLKANANARLVELVQQYESTVVMLKRVLAEKDELANQLQASNAELHEQASTDELTQLPNRRTLERTLTRDLARCERDQSPLGLIILDIDHFKRFNDTHGHQVGDIVLSAVGKVLAKGARSCDLAARYGGEEFCVVLPATDLQGCLLVARRLRLTIERTALQTSGNVLRVTASFGLAMTQADQPSPRPEELLKKADLALYEAKANGRNRVEVYTEAGSQP